MTPEQREILGTACSQRIEELLARLEELSGHTADFDRDITADPVFGTPEGSYHFGTVPRISLPVGATELTTAHELVHGILSYENYPTFGVTPHNSFIAEVVKQVAQCPLEIIVNCRLHALGYDVLAEEVERAELRVKELPDLKKDVKDIQERHLWCIFLARTAVQQSSCPPIPTSLASRFEAEARRQFPECGGLIDKFRAIVAAMDFDDPRNVQVSLRSMLMAVEQEYGHHAHFTNLRKFSVIHPAFVTVQHLEEPASTSASVEYLSTEGTKEIIIVIASRPSGKRGGSGRAMMLTNKRFDPI